MTKDHEQTAMMRKVLNVGGHSKEIGIPNCFDGWQHDLLDIDPKCKPDLLCDARELAHTVPRVYDAVYSSHNMEHFYRHDVSRVLAGFRLVLKADGFVYIRVPDMQAAMEAMVEKGLDIDDILYQSEVGPISVHDMLYGSHVMVERSGNDFMSHKCGFTRKSLTNALLQNGFLHVVSKAESYEVQLLAFKQKPSEYQMKLFGLTEIA